MPEDFIHNENSAGSKATKSKKATKKKTIIEVGQVVSEPLSKEDIKEREDEAIKDAGLSVVGVAIENELPTKVERVVKAFKNKASVAEVEAAALDLIETAEDSTDEFMSRDRERFLKCVREFIEVHEPAARKVGRNHIANDLRSIGQLVNRFEKITEPVLYWKAP